MIIFYTIVFKASIIMTYLKDTGMSPNIYRVKNSSRMISSACFAGWMIFPKRRVRENQSQEYFSEFGMTF